MRKVMVKAWEIAREGQRKFGGKVKEYFAEALRIAWIIVKKGMENVQLKGSEKQIKWAEDIRKELIEIIEQSKKGFIKLSEEKGRWEGEFKAQIEETMKVTEEILNNDSAKWYIQEFGYAGSKAYVLREIAEKVCKEKGLKKWQFVRNIGRI